MKYIIETYGKALLEGTIITLVLVLVLFNIKDNEGNKGILKIIGAQLPVEENNYEIYGDFDSYASEGAKMPPNISFDYSEMLYAEEDISIQTFIKTSDYAGGQPELRVYKIMDSFGNDITFCYNSNTGNIYFPQKGIYELELAVKDSASKKYTCTILVPVNKKG